MLIIAITFREILLFYEYYYLHVFICKLFSTQSLFTKFNVTVFLVSYLIVKVNCKGTTFVEKDKETFLNIYEDILKCGLFKSIS